MTIPASTTHDFRQSKTASKRLAAFLANKYQKPYHTLGPNIQSWLKEMPLFCTILYFLVRGYDNSELSSSTCTSTIADEEQGF